VPETHVHQRQLQVQVHGAPIVLPPPAVKS
jgi:hypothetical protein